MEVKTAYKQTEYGPVPVDWEMKPLWQFSDFITKGSTPTTYGCGWVSDGIRFLRSECVAEHGLDLKESMLISEEAHSVLSRSEVRSGDLLVTITGNVGRTILLDDDFGVGNINQHIVRVRITDSRLDKQFVLQFLSQPRVREYYKSITTGQAYPQISLKQVRETLVPVPLLSEQRAIAEALSDVDALIEKLDTLIAKKRAIKTAAIQRLLTGEQRLPGFSGAWETKRLGDMFAFLSTANNSRSDLTEYGEVAYIHYGDIHKTSQSHIDLSQSNLPFIDSGKVRNATLLEDGDLETISKSSAGYERLQTLLTAFRCIAVSLRIRLLRAPCEQRFHSLSLPHVLLR